MVDAICVDPKEVDRLWPQVSHWIRPAFERTDAGLFETTERKVLSGAALLWLAWDAPRIIGAGVTQIIRTEKSTVCELIAVGGQSFVKWAHTLETIENYARSAGCNKVQILGRRGWSRVLKNYEPTNYLFERRL